MQQMMESDLRIKQVMDLVNQNGGDPKALFYQLAQQRGINPDEFLNQVRSQYNGFMNMK